MTSHLVGICSFHTPLKANTATHMYVNSYQKVKQPNERFQIFFQLITGNNSFNSSKLFDQNTVMHPLLFHGTAKLYQSSEVVQKHPTCLTFG